MENLTRQDLVLVGAQRIMSTPVGVFTGFVMHPTFMLDDSTPKSWAVSYKVVHISFLMMSSPSESLSAQVEVPMSASRCKGTEN